MLSFNGLCGQSPEQRGRMYDACFPVSSALELGHVLAQIVWLLPYTGHSCSLDSCFFSFQKSCQYGDAQLTRNLSWPEDSFRKVP